MLLWLPVCYNLLDSILYLLYLKWHLHVRFKHFNSHAVVLVLVNTVEKTGKDWFPHNKSRMWK